MTKKFRYDINGLRAYAVALVVLFHFNVLGFSAGFIGVDIFFVISGFLMTQIIIKSLESNNFNFFKFLASRINRIVPALIFLIIGVSIVGWFTLLPQEYKDFSKHAITSIGFISNFQYLRESGYFDAGSHEKLLLHTWSLSVEWQFYIILPIALLLIHKLFNSIKTLKILYIFGFLCSFVLCVYLSQVNQSAAFYLLPTRAWEMMAGGLVFLFFSNLSLSQRSRKLLNLFGFLLILLAMFAYTPSTIWPSYNALLPVLGAALILIANYNDSILTKNPLAQFLGNTSYSVYLWHWPLVFYVSYFEVEKNIIWVILAILGSILLGWLSFKYIETPTRLRLSKYSVKRSYLVTAICSSIPLVFMAFIFSSSGFSQRLNAKTVQISNAADNINPDREKCHAAMTNKLPECIHGGSKIGLIVVGDSHADAMIRSVEKALPNNNLGVLDWTYNSCPTILGIKRIDAPNYHCSESIQYMLNNKDKYSGIPILIINRLNSLIHGDNVLNPTTPRDHITKIYDSYTDEYKQEMLMGYVDTLCKFAESHTVYVTRPIPEHTKPIFKVLGHRSIFGNSQEIYISKNDYLKRSQLVFKAQDIAAKKCGVKILNTYKYLCDEDKCRSSINNIPLYYDDDHLNIYGGDQLIPLFKTVF